MNVFPCLTDVQVEQKILTVVLNYEFSLVCSCWSDVHSPVVVNTFYALMLDSFWPASTITVCLLHAAPTLLRRMFCTTFFFISSNQVVVQKSFHAIFFLKS